MAQKVRLGSGLNSLLDTSRDDESAIMKDLQIEKVYPNPLQPRKNFSEELLSELMDSIRENGLIQPIIVRITAKGYEIIAGERRYRACKALGHETISAIIRDLADIDSMRAAIIENVQREDLNAVEEALAYSALISEYDMTHEDVADTLGKSRSYISNTLRILKMPSEVLDALANDEISVGHCKVLLGLENEEQQLRVFSAIIEKNLSVRETEKLVSKKEKQVTTTLLANTKIDDKYIEAVQNRFMSFLGTKVKINQFSRGNGKIEIDYYSDEDLERLIALLEKEEE